MKQGTEKTRFIKDVNESTDQYIFQKNKKTKIGAAVIVSILAIIMIAIMLSGIVF